MVNKVREESGAVAVLFLLGIFIGVPTGLGIWGLMRQWRLHTQTQLRLNRCVGLTALELRDHLNRIQTSNHQIEVLRLAIIAASMQPEALPALRVALRGVVQYQDLILGKWELKRGTWLVFGGCFSKSRFLSRDDAMPLPSLNFQRPSEDPVGPKKLEWISQNVAAEGPFLIQLKRSPRAAGASVFQNGQRWRAAWGWRGGDEGQIVLEALPWIVLFTFFLVGLCSGLKQEYVLYQQLLKTEAGLLQSLP